MTTYAQISAPQLEPNCGSWVIVCLSTGVVLMETFSKETADNLSELNHLRVLTAAQYLGELNE